MNKIDLLSIESLALDKISIFVSKDQISRDLGGEAVILNLKTGIYCGLNEVGARIWAFIQEPRSIKDIRETLLDEYDVDPKQCERELLELLQQMLDNSLIEVKNEADL